MVSRGRAMIENMAEVHGLRQVIGSRGQHGAVLGAEPPVHGHGHFAAVGRREQIGAFEREAPHVALHAALEGQVVGIGGGGDGSAVVLGDGRDGTSTVGVEGQRVAGRSAACAAIAQNRQRVGLVPISDDNVGCAAVGDGNGCAAAGGQMPVR